MRVGLSSSFGKIVGVILSLLFFYYLVSESKSNNKQSPETKYLEDLKKSNQQKINLLQHKVDSLNKSIKSRNEKIVKINKTKIQLEYVYTNKLKEVDNLDVNGIIEQFKIVFSKGNIK